MQVQFWGAARTVTGSMHLLEVNGRKLLLDCGLYQGHRKQAFERNRDLPFPARDVDAVVLSHAHIDHSGNLPSLVRGGFKGKIYATSATRDLSAHMLLDSAHIQESDVAYVNRHRAREGKRLFEPLYRRDDALATLKRFVSIDYEEPFDPAPGVHVHFLDAGHMLGSAVVVLDLDEAGRRVRLVFSGDIGRRGMPILRDPQAPGDADYVIMESTYGDRLHEKAGEAEETLRQAAREAYERGGKLLIPAFAVGRTQEVVYHLNRLWERGALPPMDVFVDSPLAVNVTEVFRSHPECYDAQLLEQVLDDDDGDPFGFSRLRYVRKVEESKELNRRTTPAVIISASGMCEAGRILHHLKNNIEDPRCTVFFVGFQAEHTLGRKLLDGQSPVPILGGQYPVRARIQKGESYSAHADRSGLLEWASRTAKSRRLRKVFLVHGEEASSASLAKELIRLGVAPVEVPARGQVFAL
jgi:metallo-beta-lactamase family protein